MAAPKPIGISDLEVVRVSLPAVAFGEGWRETLRSSFEREETPPLPYFSRASVFGCNRLFPPPPANHGQAAQRKERQCRRFGDDLHVVSGFVIPQGQ